MPIRLLAVSSRRVACPEQPEQAPRPAPHIDPDQHPLAVPAGQFEVSGPHQVRALHVDQPVAEDIRAEQHLSLAPLEPAQVDLGTGQLEHVALERGDLLDGHEHSRPPTVATSAVTTG